MILMVKCQRNLTKKNPEIISPMRDMLRNNTQTFNCKCCVWSGGSNQNHVRTFGIIFSSKGSLGGLQPGTTTVFSLENRPFLQRNAMELWAPLAIQGKSGKIEPRWLGIIPNVDQTIKRRPNVDRT